MRAKCSSRRESTCCPPKRLSMRFLVDENVASTVIQELRHRGHDVFSVKESMRSEGDELILARAQSEDRIVVTHDKDFGELAFRSRLPASCGIVLFRLSGSDRDSDNERMLEALDSRKDWSGNFAVVTNDRIRMRPLLTESKPRRSKPKRK
jgi:predicted nuclease of predicted toxin-antitoxin system